MRRLILLTTAAMLVIATAAPAKEITALSVCGASGCAEREAGGDAHAVLDGGTPAGPPDEKVAYYRMRIGIGDGTRTFDTVEIAWAPGLGLLQDLGGRWMQVEASTADMLDDMVAGVRPLPAATMPGAAAGAQVAEAPAAGDEFPWVAVGAVAAVLLTVGAVLLGARRRRVLPPARAS